MLRRPFKIKTLQGKYRKDREPDEELKQDADLSLPADLDEVIKKIQSALGNSADIRVHKFRALVGQLNGAAVYLESFVDIERLNDSVLLPLLRLNISVNDIAELAKALPCAGSQELSSFAEFNQAVVFGEVLVLVSGQVHALSIPLKKYGQRTVDEPENERIVRGPRDGFVESIWTNIGLIRQRIRNPQLRLEVITLGIETSVEVGIIYIDGIANRQIVEEVRQRLKRINVDRMLSSGSTSEFIADSPWSPFPTIQFTERPDRLSSALLDGRVGILLDGTPSASIVPTVFWEFLKSPDDYIENVYFITLIRLIRFTAHLVTLLLPGAYIALTTIHLQMLPESLAVIIAGARTRTPFPGVVEMIVMELMVEILREAGLRMPGILGQTMSIVGALVIGEAAVTAGLIEPMIVVVVAITTLSSFIVPGYNAAISIRLLRFPLILLGGSLGFFGLALGAVFYLMHLISLRSFGVPYFAPVAPLIFKDMGDIFTRLPSWQQSLRPTFYRTEDQIKKGRNQKPGPEKGG